MKKLPSNLDKLGRFGKYMVFGGKTVINFNINLPHTTYSPHSVQRGKNK